MSRPIAIWMCGPDLEHRWAMAMCEEQQRGMELEEDLALELALNPFELCEDIEYVPLHVALSWRD